MSIIKLDTAPCIEAAFSVVGRREADGPLGDLFDHVDKSDSFKCDTWEKAESEMQRIALDGALAKAGKEARDLGAIFAGDLLDQCTGSAYGLATFDAPFFGLYGACSTCAEALLLAALSVDSGKLESAAAVCSSHNCSAERQFRFPLEYGGQRTPSAQWTVTGAAAFIIGRGEGALPRITEFLPGKVTDRGICDIGNMGAAMAPAALDTLTRYFEEEPTALDELDAVITGDLGYVGSRILVDLLCRDGIDISKKHYDCGLMIYDRKKQDMHAGGSGCGCSATVLAAHFLKKLRELELKHVLFVATGAMMSPSSLLQGLTIPGIAHLIRLDVECSARE